MQLQDAVVLVTGANRGLGAEFVAAALAGGARKVYAAARDPASVHRSGAHPLRLDVTSAADIESAARACSDVTLLINNAGISRPSPLLDAEAEDHLRAELDTNLFGPMKLTRSFAPVLATNGGGAVINVLSVASWINLPGAPGYCVSKSAAWSLTNGLRHALRANGTRVLALHVGYMDTDMTRGVDAPKAVPADVVRQVYEALAAGHDELCADELSRHVRQGVSATPGVYLLPPA